MRTDLGITLKNEIKTVQKNKDSVLSEMQDKMGEMRKIIEKNNNEKIEQEKWMQAQSDQTAQSFV